MISRSFLMASIIVMINDRDQTILHFKEKSTTFEADMSHIFKDFKEIQRKRDRMIMGAPQKSMILLIN